MHIADLNALGARLGWLPSFPSFDRNSLDLVDEAERAGVESADYVVSELRSGRLRFACEDPVGSNPSHCAGSHSPARPSPFPARQVIPQLQR